MTYEKELYQSIIAHSGDLIFVTTTTGQILFVSANVNRILDFEVNDLHGVNLQELIHTDDKEELLRAIEIVASSASVSTTIEVRLKNRSEKWKWLEIIVVKQTENAAVNGIIMNARDITTRKESIERANNMVQRIEAQLAYRNKELDTFIYRASHDLRGPVTTLMGLTEIAILDTDDEEAKEYFSNCRDLAFRMERTIYNLLSVTQVRQSALNIMTVQPKEIIYRAIKDKKHADLIAYTTFEVLVNDTLNYNTDAALLGIIIAQLTDNAIIFRKGDGQHVVSIKLEASDTLIKIQVWDSGTGISAAEQNLIFDLYYRGKNDHTGNGIGLYLVKAAVDKLGGSIRVNSLPGHGTEIVVHVPNCLTKIS